MTRLSVRLYLIEKETPVYCFDENIYLVERCDIFVT